jgi:hypothetical protein
MYELSTKLRGIKKLQVLYKGPSFRSSPFRSSSPFTPSSPLLHPSSPQLHSFPSFFLPPPSLLPPFFLLLLLSMVLKTYKYFTKDRPFASFFFHPSSSLLSPFSLPSRSVLSLLSPFSPFSLPSSSLLPPFFLPSTLTFHNSTYVRAIDQIAWY